MNNPYEQDEWYDDDRCSCGEEFDSHHHCPICDYGTSPTCVECGEETEDGDNLCLSCWADWNAQRSVDMFGPDGYDEDGNPFVELS